MYKNKKSLLLLFKYFKCKNLQNHFEWKKLIGHCEWYCRHCNNITAVMFEYVISVYRQYNTAEQSYVIQIVRCCKPAKVAFTIHRWANLTLVKCGTGICILIGNKLIRLFNGYL